ncbi:hypothetical protein AYO44_02840 [Planctomycetaceae bacterium SCGC AG-212-F19]|nr:hypothetical protein AYO44_02840 [Planctomycetaceae bacterium SCGC AG-212-F19]
MAKGQLYHLLGFLRRLTVPLSGDAETDGQLLQRVLSERDELAFQTLMQRHGPMVLATCQRVLHDADEAEDAFQATFLVLARKARAIANQASLASWLYRVAYHIALNARARLAQRRAREREVADMAWPTSTGEVANPELRRVLDEELAQLPEKYRAPLVLCYLEGKTHEEAARALCWPAGSMSRRLARGQQLLQRRLVRRGVALSVAGLGSSIAASASSAAVPPALTQATASVAVRVAAGEAAAGLGSAEVAALVDEALAAMAPSKLKIAAAILLTVGLVSAGAAALVKPGKEAPGSVMSSDSADQFRANREPDWGQSVHGFRLRCSPDRPQYRWGKDLVRVDFALQNVAAAPNPILLMRDGEEFTDLRIVGPDGKEHLLPGREWPLPRRASWGGSLQPDAVEHVSAIFDPGELDGGLEPGRYRVRGIFRRQPPAGSKLTAADFRLESNEMTFTIAATGQATDTAWPAGERTGPCSLTLLPPGTRHWKPGDAPLDFTVVLNRRDDDLRTLRWLGSNRLGMYYHLEITGPNGEFRHARQYAASAGVDPVSDPFAAARLMFLQLDRIPIGKTLGERIAWDPSGQPVRDGWQGEPIACTGPLFAPGAYQIRAVYQLRAQDQAAHAGNPLAVRLVSNTVAVCIGE